MQRAFPAQPTVRYRARPSTITSASCGKAARGWSPTPAPTPCAASTSAPASSAPTGIADDSAGHIYFAGGYTIRRYDAATRAEQIVAGAYAANGTTDGPGAAARFNAPVALASDGQGHLYVAASGNGLIRRIDLATGAVSTVVGQAGQQGVRLGALPARLNQPTGIAALPDGSLAIADERAVLIAR